LNAFEQALGQKVLVFDGAMGTALQALQLPLDAFQQLEGCPEILNLTRPDAVRGIHAAYLEAGADAVETNSFGATPLLLAEHGLSERTVELNEAAARIAREACDAASSAHRPRFVLGSIGPGTRLPSLGQVSWRQLQASYRQQVLGLVQGGADVLLLETAQDLLQIKAALAGIRLAFGDLRASIPVMAQVTIEPTGSMLVGSDISAALAVLEAYDLVAIGLNCATGPQEMAPHVAWLARHCRRAVSVLPNAGLPEVVAGEAHYPLGPEEFATWVERFVLEDGVNIVGGCCGTTPAHIAALAARVAGLPPLPREPSHQPSLASLYTAVPLRQDTDILAIGERANANGSAACRKALQREDYDAVVGLARTQVSRGSHALDICAAVVGRDERQDMVELVARLRTQVQAPLVIDSTDPEVLDAALELVGGRAVINSVNLEEGEARADSICRLARKHGAALVALTIDEQGMARSPERKLEVAERLHHIAVDRHGIEPSALLFDPLTFTICTGLDDDRRLALWTLQGIRLIRERFPEAGVLLGLSNVSFGLTGRARPVLNSVFLHQARQAGLTAAILHARGVLPLFTIDERLRRAAEDLVHDRWQGDRDPLQHFLACAQELGPGAGPADDGDDHADETAEQRLVRRVIEGSRAGLEEDLERCLANHPPMVIINDLLLEGMRTVGEHFAAGQTQLPFVLQSAEVVKASVTWLEPHLQRGEHSQRGRLLLATVRGDVHDIGKNLVEILLSNNGFEVIDLGIKQPVDAILSALREHQPDALGLSGLLVRSTTIMRDVLQELRRQQISIPVILGGAALNRRFVERDCSAAYGRPVAYGRDAFVGLRFAEELEKARAAGLPSRWELPLDSPAPPAPRAPAPAAEPPPEPQRVPTAVIPPPFSGSRVLAAPALPALMALLDHSVLYRARWGFKSARKGSDEWKRQIHEQLRPLLDELMTRVQAEGWLNPGIVRGYYPCHGGQQQLLVHSGGAEPLALTAPRGRQVAGLSGWFPAPDQPPDTLGLMAVTVGDGLVQAARDHYRRGEYRDYLLLHGMASELTEALAAWTHQQMRHELGIADRDHADPERLLQGAHRGRRYAFGYPALPHTAEQGPVLQLLGAERIGLRLGTERQLHPELSTTAVIVHHPAARYFRV